MPLSNPKPNLSHWHPKSSLYTRQGLRSLGHINYIRRLPCHLTSGSTQTTASRRREESKVMISSPCPLLTRKSLCTSDVSPPNLWLWSLSVPSKPCPSGLERLTLPYSCCFKCQCFPQASSDLYKLPLNVVWNSTSWGHVSVVDLRPEAVYVIPLHPFCKGWYDAKEGDE